MMRYADFPFYIDVFGGNLVPRDDFARFAARASRSLDALTFGRIDRVYAQCHDVRMACCAMAEVLWEAREPEVVREKLDAYEVAYAAPDPLSLKKRLLDAARVYLWRTGLLRMAVCAHG